MPRFNPIMDELATYPIVELERRTAAVEARGIRLYDFGKGDPVEPTPDFIRAAMFDAVKPICGYPTVSGKPEIRAAIAAYLLRRFGVTVDPDTQVIPTAGSKEVCFHLPMLVVDTAADDRTVVFPDPGYPAYQRGVLFAGGDPYAAILTGDHVLRPWTLPADVIARTRMIWLNNPHNPSGAVTGLDDLRRAAEFCRAHDILLICDETYQDIYQDLVPHSVLEVAMEGVLVLHSLSKRSGMTGYRSGFIAGCPDLIARLKRFRANPGLVPQDFVNAAAAAAWGDDAHVAARRQVFIAKKQLFMDFFDEVGFEVVGPAATIYLWIKAPAGYDDETWSSALLESGIVVSPGRMFGVAGGGAGYVRLALVPSLEECREAIALWRTLL